jgi:hypothetical protein
MRMMLLLLISEAKFHYALEHRNYRQNGLAVSGC